MSDKRNNSAVYKLQDGTYTSETRIQDGTERGGPFKTELEAKQWCKDAERVMNGLRVKKKHIPVFAAVTSVAVEWRRVS